MAECSDSERTWLLAYLDGTPVAGMAAQARLSHLPVWRARIVDGGRLGCARTIFQSLGQARSKELYGEATFRVAQVLPTLSASPPPDPDMLATIGNYMRAVRDGLPLDIIQTFCATAPGDGDALIIDGNKRAVALYEVTRKSGEHLLNLPVYVIGSRG